LRGTLGDRVDAFIAKTGISRPTAYRMMASGKLKYAQVGERIRLIPISEYARLGLVESETAS
jgi:excisionase family DNA binding protein